LRNKDGSKILKKTKYYAGCRPNTGMDQGCQGNTPYGDEQKSKGSEDWKKNTSKD
jgi:hypothetical protein